ncbi:MAG: type VI secretion system protein TssA [Rubrivivax sp.]|nr:MAG: type VI secretion system protein TssA [Rubrivivax sp.]
MSAPPLDLEALSADVEQGLAAGPELDGDPEFQELEIAGAGTPERQYGDNIYAAEPPDWPRVYRLALSLAQRSRDVRLVIWLIRSGARLHGFMAAVQGLRLLQRLLEQRWSDVHPQLDASDDNDPTMRLNALLPLASDEAVLADLRVATLAPVRGSIDFRQLELAFGKVEPLRGESVPNEQALIAGLQQLSQAHPELAADLASAQAVASSIAQSVEAQVGIKAPDLRPLVRLLGAASAAAARLSPQHDAAPDEAAGSAVESPAAGFVPASQPGALRGREDVARELDRLCQWLEQHEPGHPAPLLLRRAQRLMQMNFMDIIREMAPNGLEQVQTVVGPQPE